MNNKEIISKIDTVLAEYMEYSNKDVNIRLPADDYHIITQLCNVIDIYAPPGSVFRGTVDHALDSDDIKGYTYPNAIRASRLYGILSSLKQSYQLDMIAKYEDLVHANVFSDFLEMAEYLLHQGYKDAAAVLIGGVLEEHIKKLAIKNKIEMIDKTQQGNDRPKSIEKLNSELCKDKAIYSQVVRQQVNAWYTIRTAAAHRKYEEYDDKNVQNMLDGIQNFIEQYN